MMDGCWGPKMLWLAESKMVAELSCEEINMRTSAPSTVSNHFKSSAKKHLPYISAQQPRLFDSHLLWIIFKFETYLFKRLKMKASFTISFWTLIMTLSSTSLAGSLRLLYILILPPFALLGLAMNGV